MLPLSVYYCSTQERLARIVSFRGILSTAHRGEGCRRSSDAEAHGASRQCLAASFQALYPGGSCCCFCLKQQHGVNISLPPTFLLPGASFTKMEVLQAGPLGNSFEKCEKKNKRMSFTWWILCVIVHNEECIANQTGEFY